MKLKIQAPEEKEKLPEIYKLLLVGSFLMLAVTLFFLTGFVVSQHG